MYRPRRGSWFDADDFFGSRWPQERTATAGRFEDVAGEDGDGEQPSDGEAFQLLQRVQADFVNYKRRVEEEREEQSRSANRDLIARLLPVLDDLERALDSPPPDRSGADWADGIELIHRKLVSILEQSGVRKIDAENRQFDPWEHEAVLTEESSDHEEGAVKSVLRPGYKLWDKVIRPAQVVVSSGRRSHY